jgi:hypothetical protein
MKKIDRKMGAGVCLPWFCLLLLLLPAHAERVKFKAPASKEAATFTLSGRVVNAQGKPMGGLPVLLWEKDGELSLSCKTSRNGEFDFEHREAGELVLEVNPPLKTELAQAMVEGLPGKEGRKIVVSLKPGHLVSGRVMHAGKPLKGLIVRADALEAGVHSGGVTVSQTDGSFGLILTPGAKRLSLVNNTYSDLPKTAGKKILVDGPTHLGALEL